MWDSLYDRSFASKQSLVLRDHFRQAVLDTGYKQTQVHSKTIQIIFTHAIFDLAERFLFLSLPVALVSLCSQCVLNTYVHTLTIRATL